ncbi:MAG: transposase [Candidatus Thiodiazotropha sp.]
MPRASRYFLPGHVWHITHRCHMQSFLLKFERDRKRWVYWLFEAKKRFGLCVLNYIVTSNHIHLLVKDTGHDVIPKSMQLIAGRVAQEFNHRKTRKGAFWEDRYHATAIDTGDHLSRCIAYIDLNMVRAGAVKHPAEWSACGYCEIENSPKRYRIIDQPALLALLELQDIGQFRQAREEWISTAMRSGLIKRDKTWSNSLAVGRKEYVDRMKQALGVRARTREIEEVDDRYAIRELSAAYADNFALEIGLLSEKNAFIWNEI